MKELYIGLMSGTSADGVDAVLMAIAPQKISLIANHSITFTKDLKAKIIELFEPSNNEIDRLGELDRELAYEYAHCVNQLLTKSQYQANQITAIGCHGQTIRHRPNYPTPFTFQIGDASLLAQRTGIDVISDFRKADINQGGQGAPLAPAFHKALFKHPRNECFIINIGGIANITHLPLNGHVTGWDIGPGNGLMDSWINKYNGKPYDHNGKWAASGSINQKLLNRLLSHSYFERKPPKSTGKEEFTLGWLEKTIQSATPTIQPQDVQATLLALTAKSIARTINQLIRENQIAPPQAYAYICGGGALNGEVISSIQKYTPVNISTTQALGICPMAVEAAAFAWLAYQFTHRLPGNLPRVTGALKPAILGALTPHF